MHIVFHGIIAGGWLALLAAPSLAGQPMPVRRALETLRFDTLVPLPVFSSPELDKESAGLPKNSRPEVLTWERVFALALIRFRAGGGPISETLIPSELEANSKTNGVDDFTRFRTDFLANRVEGRGTFRDPAAEYLQLLCRLQAITSGRRDCVFLEALLTLMRELVQGSTGGLSQLDVDRVNSSFRRARLRLAEEIGRYRSELDHMKVALGLSPHAPIVADRRILAAFGSAFEGVDHWFRNPHRDLAELHTLVDRLPALGSFTVGGRTLPGAVEPNPSAIEEILTDAVREANKNRNAGAQHGEAPQIANIQLELQVRRRLRHLLELRTAYDGERHSYELAARLEDQAFERLVAPATGVTGPRSPLFEALLAHVAEGARTEVRLVELWTEFRAERLALYRDIGVLPYDNWQSLYADLSASTPAAALGPNASAKPAAPGADRLPAPPAPKVEEQPAPPAPGPGADRQPAPPTPAPRAPTPPPGA